MYDYSDSRGNRLGHAAVAIELPALECQKLECLARARHTGQAFARRARIVLVAADGHENRVIHNLTGAETIRDRRPVYGTDGVCAGAVRG
ncbi:hypothetical protein [Gluconobacter cerinus]|uniref:hypothetical protein n=1 Tax=Gluconobacter cerinus TaxID=38307 RepID=UPI001B8C0832|nr:hypothetical protein [Gluconobacter cerinus]MBS0983307.1 hypothetical protein [Gluconobacter cerinus]